MPLGKELGLGPGHNVLDGDPVGTQRSPTAAPPHLSADVYCGFVAKRSPISATAELLLPGRRRSTACISRVDRNSLNYDIRPITCRQSTNYIVRGYIKTHSTGRLSSGVQINQSINHCLWRPSSDVQERLTINTIY